ncbi:hypothetical protein TNCV_48541 [Trichonephila clavipes]|nr:hypothetical protein TNCV_48541 [Trichonephila clavipes]
MMQQFKTGPSNSRVKRICKQGGRDNLVALHFKYDQARRRFVEWAQNEIAVVPDFHKRILFSDEALFWLNGYVNKQNCRIWSEANPQVYVETPLHPEKLTVWCALWAGTTETSRNITARVIERDTSAEIYNFLEDFQRVPLANMVANDAKMIAKVTKVAAILVAKNDANLALLPRFRQVLIEASL